MEQSQRAARPLQLHPAKAAIVDLFNLYLGRNSRQKPEDSSKEASNKLQKRVTAPIRELPPRNEQFLLDFQQLQGQFQDQEQLCAATESVLVSFVVQCSGHGPQSDFILYALRSLCSVGYIKWDTFLPSLLSTVSSAEASVGPGSPTMAGPLMTSPSSSSVIPNASNFQTSNPTSPVPSMHIIGSPAQSATDQSISATLSPVKPSDLAGSGQNPTLRANQSVRITAISCLRQLVCKIVLASLESNLKPVTHFEVFSHMINWLVNWDQKQQGSDDADAVRAWKSERPSHEWMHICLGVIWRLVEEDKCRIPFYELIRSALQYMDNIPDDEALFSIILEIHRRRDLVATHMQMLDQHLHCPTFATHRFLSQSYPTIPGESITNLRYSPITYPSVLGEPLHGEDLAMSIQRGSLDWERAVRCLRHALHTTPSPEWWRRVLVVAPCYKPPQAPFPGAVFSPEMICEAAIDRTIELLKMTHSETQCWQDWLIFADLFFFLMKSGCIDFLDFVHKLSSRVNMGDKQILWSNHVTWLLAQIIRIETVMNTLNSDPKKVETTRKIISFHKEDKNPDASNINPQSILLDFISSSQTLRIWSFNSSIREYLNSEQLQKGKQIDEWWKQATKGERTMDFMNLDDRSMGMFWVLSFTMVQPACEAVMNWFTSVGVTEILQGPNVQTNDRMMMMRETYPLSMSLLSGLSVNLCLKLAYQLEEVIFLGQIIPSIAMVETYVRLLLIAPHSLFRPHFTTLISRSPTLFSKSNVLILLLEILNYRLLPIYRYHGKHKALIYDVTKIISMLKGKRGEHRPFRLAENLYMNLLLSLRDFFLVKKELKGPTEFTETLNRITIISLAITIKTRGIAEVEHMLYLQPLLEQILGTSQHTWSEKTVRYFPPLIRDALTGRMDKRGQAIQAWQQAETTVINQCTQLLSSSSADPTYVMTYLSHSFPQHRQYLCAGAWMLMNGHPESINSANLGRVLREVSPEEVTSNLYTMVDVLLHQIQIEQQRGHPVQDLQSKVIANLSFFIWTHELLPLDILLLALIDRDDDPYALRIVISLLDRPELQQRIKLFCTNRISPEHWLNNQLPKRVELQKALGNHLSWKERHPPFFDDIVARLIPVIPLIIYRLIENDATDIAERVLALYSSILIFHPFRFTFVRDILAYFYGHLPSKLIVRILKVLDISKIPFSESFPQHVSSANPMCPPPDYFASLLLGLVNNVIPPLCGKSKSESAGDPSSNSLRPTQNKSQASSQSGGINSSDGQKTFYQNQDPGTYTQLVLETAVIEILSLPVSSSQIVSSLVQIVVHVQPSLIQSSSGLQGMSIGTGQNAGLPTSPSGASVDSNANRVTPSATGILSANFVSKSGYSCQQLSCLMIQACGLLLAHLPQEFHMQLYSEASRIIKDCWWLSDTKRSPKELDSAVGYALLDPTWASQDNTSTAIGNIVALLHAFFSNLPHEWLESTHTVIKHLRPVTSVAMMRIAFRIMGPLLPRLAFARPLFMKTLALLFNVLADVFGKNSQPSSPIDASEITDIIDFLHHVVMYEGQGGPVQSTSKPKIECLTLCGKVVDLLRPDVAHLFTHLTTDPNSSIYAATHPKLVQNPA